MRPCPRLLVVAAFAAVPFLLNACATPAPPRPNFPPITFEGKAPIRLDVSEISVELAYQAPAAPPNVDHLFPARLSDAALQWPKDRLVAAGTVYTAEYVVRDASVVAVPLKPSTGLTGLVTKDQTERYDARVAVEMRILDSQRRVVGSAAAEAVRSRSAPEDITLNDRDKLWYEMAKDIMAELDRQLEQTIKTSLFPYLVQ